MWEWWELRSPCEGALSRSLVDAASGGDDLQRQTHSADQQAGQYECVLYSGEEPWAWVVSVTATTRPEEINERIVGDLIPEHTRASVETMALPGGLPGVFTRGVGADGLDPWRIHLLQDCPALPADDGQMLATLTMPRLSDLDAMVRLSAEAAAAASAGLGCGAAELTPSAESAADLETRQLAESTDTPCAVLDQDDLPTQPWLINSGTPQDLPFARCTLTLEDSNVVVEWSAWYGDLADLALDALVPDWEDPVAVDDLPLWTPGLGLGVAECPGGPALFGVVAGLSAEGHDVDATTALDGLTRFAADEITARGCESLRLPSLPR